MAAFKTAHRLPDALTDLWYRLAGQRAQPDKPVIFWGPRYAQACAVLREARAAVVGMDMLFSASPEQWLAKLVALPEFDTGRFVGAADLLPDPDGTQRRFYPAPPVERTAAAPSPWATPSPWPMPGRRGRCLPCPCATSSSPMP